MPASLGCYGSYRNAARREASSRRIGLRLCVLVRPVNPGGQPASSNTDAGLGMNGSHQGPISLLSKLFNGNGNMRNYYLFQKKSTNDSAPSPNSGTSQRVQHHSTGSAAAL